MNQPGDTLPEVTNLPAAIQVLSAQLVVDGGRCMAETLMAVQAADPEYVRPYLSSIDVALGDSSPGMDGLEKLVQQAEDAVSTSQPSVKHQHVISQVVLRRFVEDVPPGGNQLTRINLLTGNLDLIGTNGVGYIDDFVPVDSQSTEKLWQEVENKLYQAIMAALNGAAHNNLAHLVILKQAVALHLVRNPQTLAVHNQSFADAVEAGIERWSRTPFADESFRRRYGLIAAGPEARRLGAAAAQGRLVDLHRIGGLFRLSVQRLYEKVADRFDGREVEVLIPASGSKEFLIGDQPAVTVNTATGATGFGEGVAVDQADKVLMPLSPRLVVAVGTTAGMRMISDDEVDDLNKLQVRMADRYVVHRPGGSFGESSVLNS